MTSRRETSCRAGSSLPQPFFQEKRKIINGRRQTLRMLSILRMRSTADGRHNAAFTLLELLVVIAIIVILIGLLSVGLMGARRQALYKATKGRIAQLELALEAYYNDYRFYPPDTFAAFGLLPIPAQHDENVGPQDIECLVYGLTVVRPYIELKRLGRHNADGDDYDGHLLYEIWDAWNNPLHYASPGTNNITFVDIWSSGPDRVDDSGAEDDINNWERD